MKGFNQLLRISVVTPTLRRPNEVVELLNNLSRQIVLPFEVILVDGAPAEEKETEQVVQSRIPNLPFRCVYVRHSGGTAIQRNAGIDRAGGELIAFIDDDIRLEPEFFERMLEVYAQDAEGRTGGVAGYITNQFLNPDTSPRWKWYRRLHLFRTYEPGRYDFETGYPINRYLQPPHNGLRPIDFMGSNCALWRREVFDGGLRFSPFFTGYGVLEDAHFALRAGRKWKLLECGNARCVHLHAQGGRTSSRLVARKSAVNYRFVFIDLVPQRTAGQEFRFWRVQIFDLLRMCAYAVRNGGSSNWLAALGKLEGIFAAARMKPVQPARQS
jgi:glycosyltransferase involved in cell wall biosynthesis